MLRQFLPNQQKTRLYSIVNAELQHLKPANTDASSGQCTSKHFDTWSKQPRIRPGTGIRLEGKAQSGESDAYSSTVTKDCALQLRLLLGQ